MRRRAAVGKIVKGKSGLESRANTVGLDDSDLESLLGQMDSPSSAAASAQREFARWVFRAPSIQMRFRHSSGSSLDLRVACRNLSCGGVSVLHNAYVHVGTQCTLMLPRPRKEPVSVAGRVVRCQHRQGMIHELGIMFAAPIRIRDFCSPGPLIDRFSFENVDPTQLRGTVLVVSGAELHRKLVGHYLSPTNVKLHEATTCAEALKMDLTGIDVIIADHELEDGTAESLLAEVRSSREPVAFIEVVSKSFAVRPKGDSVAPDAYLRAPLESQSVLRALAEFMIGPASGLGTAAEGRHADLRDDVVRECRALKAAIKTGDAIGCYSICMNLRDAAESAGLDHLTRLASRVAKSLGEELELQGSGADLEAILEAGKLLEAA